MAFWPLLSKPSPVIGYALDCLCWQNCGIRFRDGFEVFLQVLQYYMSYNTSVKDGLPIRGPYGFDGRLVNVSELDECNGRSVINEPGTHKCGYFTGSRSKLQSSPSCCSVDEQAQEHGIEDVAGRGVAYCIWKNEEGF